MANTIANNLSAINSSIASAAKAVNRTAESVQILAVSKGQSAQQMNEYTALLNGQGQRAYFGENYLQEFLQKKDLLQGDYEVHFIGRAQSNKLKQLLENFTVIESIASLDQLHKLNNYAAGREQQAAYFIQVNISQDPRKAGVATEQLSDFIAAAGRFTNLRLLGLMTILEDQLTRDKIAADYLKMAALRGSLSSFAQEKDLPLATLKLSMGMSADYDLAIAAGADIVRIGTALFGSRIKG